MANTEETGEILIYSPLSGDVVALDQVPDPTFSEKLMGDGIAIDPKDGKVVAPFDGEVIQVFPTKHAIGLNEYPFSSVYIDFKNKRLV